MKSTNLCYTCSGCSVIGLKNAGVKLEGELKIKCNHKWAYKTTENHLIRKCRLLDCNHTEMHDIDHLDPDKLNALFENN